ncbi:hypothetical protein C8J55DRAFT_556177 [Lentinula edodes]|uniref:Uncharacterized protein n=1 Tax=Lentinula lateritia TaxID=40482 RepID=A0A9W9DZH0_9AGAR|nr:hypothetical protein C8J55DRAFT_556177 [Lentinula edodes]
MPPSLEFIRRDNTSFTGSIQPPFSFVPFSATSSTPSSVAFTSPSLNPNSGASTSFATTSSTSTDEVSTSTTSSSSSTFSEVVTSISATHSFPSTRSSLATSIATSTLATFTTSPSFTPSITFTSSISSTSSASITSITSISVTTLQSFQASESASSPSGSVSVPATTTNIAITDGTSTSVVFATTSISGQTAVASSSSSSSVGFWSNKAAVAGTFTAVAVVALATLAGVILCIRKKRRDLHSRDRSISEKFASMDFADTRPYSTPSEPASHDLSHEPMDAYANRDPAFYLTHDPFVANAHNMPYAGSASLPEITYSYAQDVNNQYPYYGNEANNVVPPSVGTRSTPALPTQDPRNPFESVNITPPRNAAMPQELERISSNPFEEPAFRASYQPSVDSFYGASIDGRPF